MPTIKELNQQGTAEYNQGNFQVAANIFENAIKQHTENPDHPFVADVAKSYYNLSCAKAHLNEYASAYNHLTEATNLAKPFPELYMRCELRKKRAYLDFYLSMMDYGPSDTVLSLYQKSLPRMNELFKRHFQIIKTEIENTPEDQDYVITSLGCGKAEEFYALWLFLGDKLFNKIRFIGIDINEDDISALNGIAKICDLSNVTFNCIDARLVHEIKKITPTANWIIMRHPEVLGPNDPTNPFWNILTNTIPALAKMDGTTHIFISTFTREECELTHKLLTRHAGGISTATRVSSVDLSIRTITEFEAESYIIVSHNYAPKKELVQDGKLAKQLTVDTPTTTPHFGHGRSASPR